MAEAQSARETVLVIDDSAIVLEVTKASLESAGFRVITRSRTSGAVSAILAVRPDVVLLDVNMPLISGDVIAGILARTGPALNTTILLYSSLPIEVLRLKAISAGAHGYIVKTSDRNELVRQVRHWLRRARSAVRHRPLRMAGVSESAATSAEHDLFGAVSGAAGIGTATIGSALQPSLGLGDDSGASAPPPRKHSGALRVSSAARVLFIDDDPVTLAAYRRELGVDDLDMAFTQSGNEGLASIFSNDPPDVVVCDIMLRDLGGIEIYRQALERDSSWKHRFVFVTGAASVPHVAEFLNEIESRVLFKPVDSRRLRAAIRYSATGARMFRRDGVARSGE